jgi:hypothetical protein
VPGDGTRDAVRRQALEVAAGWSGPMAPPSWALTAALFRTIAADPELLDLAASIPADRLPPLLLSAGVRRLLDRMPDQALAAYFPEPGGPQPPLNSGFSGALQEFCLQHRTELLRLCSTHRYQMNEVARCAQLALALGVISTREPGRPGALIDVGTGSGLALHLDHYRYEIAGIPPFGDLSSPLTIHCALRGERRPPRPGTWPPIVSRTGVDRNPIDLADADALAWLRACVPPETESLSRFEGAVLIALRQPVTVITGDGCDDLPALLASIPSEPLTVVMDAYTTVFFEDERLRRFRDTVEKEAARRDVAWISLDPLVPLGAEGRSSVQGLAVPSRLVEEYREEGVFGVLGLVDHRDGERSSRLLARAHPSGTWIEWLDLDTGS